MGEALCSEALCLHHDKADGQGTTTEGQAEASTMVIGDTQVFSASPTSNAHSAHDAYKSDTGPRKAHEGKEENMELTETAWNWFD